MRDKRRSSRIRALARWMFHGHLWLGVLGTALFLVVSVTGVLLNHKRALGLMPEAREAAGAPLADALSLAELVVRAEEVAGAAVAQAGVDRMDVRPSDSVVKVRFGDRRVVEVSLDLHTGAVLAVGERNDVFLEKLHSGEIFGDPWILLSDAAALALVLLVLSGYWIWLYPRSRR